jgi:predicted nucleic-acid-binding Zn-ribbon protein
MAVIKASEAPCPFCGSTEFTWGRATNEMDVRRPVKPPADASKSVWQVLAYTEESRWAKRRLLPRFCEQCGNVQFFDASHVWAQRDDDGNQIDSEDGDAVGGDNV